MGYEVLNLKQEKSLLMTKGIIVENNKAETNLDSGILHCMGIMDWVEWHINSQ